MKRNFYSKKRAFTLTETLISVSVIALIAAMTVCNTIASGNLEEKKIKASSQILYTDFENAYQDIVITKTNGYNITKLKNVEDFEQDASNVLKGHLFSSMDLFDENCNSLPNSPNVSGYLDDISTCAYSNRGYNIGISLKDQTCSSSYQVKDYYQDNTNTRIVENACGYIVYATKKSKGIIGKDFFIIALGKRKIL